jgi:hypothetical protein
LGQLARVSKRVRPPAIPVGNQAFPKLPPGMRFMLSPERAAQSVCIALRRALFLSLLTQGFGRCAASALGCCFALSALNYPSLAAHALYPFNPLILYPSTPLPLHYPFITFS